MTQQLDDRTGAPVTVRFDEAHPTGIYTVNLADGSPVGRVEFVDSPEVVGERIFFHTEVDVTAVGSRLRPAGATSTTLGHVR